MAFPSNNGEHDTAPISENAIFHLLSVLPTYIPDTSPFRNVRSLDWGIQTNTTLLQLPALLRLMPQLKELSVSLQATINIPNHHRLLYTLALIPLHNLRYFEMDSFALYGIEEEIQLSLAELLRSKQESLVHVSMMGVPTGTPPIQALAGIHGLTHLESSPPFSAAITLPPPFSSSLHHHFSEIAGNCLNIRVLRLHIGQDERHNEGLTSFTFNTLRPLAACRFLMEFQVIAERAQQLSLQEGDIEEIGTAWPDLQILHLDAFSGSDQHDSGIPIFWLSLFASSMPNLVGISLPFNGWADIPMSNTSQRSFNQSVFIGVEERPPFNAINLLGNYFHNTCPSNLQIVENASGSGFHMPGATERQYHSPVKREIGSEWLAVEEEVRRLRGTL